jgi:hypothetical protein
MPPLGKGLRCIAPAAAFAIDFGWIKNTNKTQQLASVCTVLSIQKHKKIITQNRPSTQLIEVTGFVEKVFIREL